MTLLGYSVEQTIVDDRGNALKSRTLAVTGPDDYEGVVVTDADKGAVRLGPLPIGEYTVTYGDRSAVFQVLPTAADLQAAYDAATGASPSSDVSAEVAAREAADAAEASARAAAVTAEAAARASAVAAEAVARAAADATDDTDDSAEVAARIAADSAEATARAAADSAESAARAALDAREAAHNAAQATAVGDEATARAAAVTAEAAARTAADAALQSSITANTTAIGQRLIAVDHGSVAGTARPTSTLPVKWFGTVAPTNAVTNDEWYDRTTELLKRYNGSSWQPAGSGTHVTVVEAGSTASTPRPSGAVLVLWVVDGIEPENLVENDTVLDPAAGTWSVYDGAALVPLGGGGGGSAATWPTDVARFTIDATCAVTALTVFDADGESTAVAAGDDTGLPWLMYADDGTIYTASNARAKVLAVINRSDAADGVVRIQNGGWANMGFLAPQRPEGPSLQVGVEGTIDGTPSGWESGGPDSEPGFDALSIFVNGTIEGGYLFLNLLT